MNICIPTLDNNGLESAVSSHFGQALFFIIIDDGTNDIKTIKNTAKGGHQGTAGLTPGQLIMEQEVNVVLCGGLGVRAVQMFEQAGIHVFNQASGTVADAMKAYKEGKLPEATDATACQKHAH
jgi:predicted Fe-Mo cluster-binding NifX family protein